MFRPTSTVLHIPLAELTEPQLIFDPALIEAGLSILVVAPEDAPGFIFERALDEPNLPDDIRRRWEARQEDERDPLLVLRCDDHTVDLYLVDDDGKRVCGAMTHQAGDALHHIFSRVTSVSTTSGARVHENTGATALQIAVPLRFQQRGDDPIENMLLTVAELAPESADRIRDAIAPAWRLRGHRCAYPEDLRLGTSRMNGSPDLPDSLAWPQWDGPIGRATNDGIGTGPLTFLAQIDLASLPPIAHSPLPATGWLVFFADFERSAFSDPYEQAAHRVVYVPADATLKRRRPPLSDPFYGENHMALDGYGVAGAIEAEVISSVPVDEIYDVVESIDEPGRTELSDIADGLSESSSEHQLLGHSSSCQDHALLECVRGVMPKGLPWEAVRSEAEQWQLLFQYGSDHTLQQIIGGGAIYIAIRKDDLAASRFDRTAAAYQR